MVARPEPLPIESTPEEPLLKLSRLLVGVASPSGNSGRGVQLMVDGMNSDTLTCKCRELVEEGSRLTLALLLTGVGHVKLQVQVDWVLLSSFGHSLGLRVLHSDETREQLRTYVELQKNGSRG